MSRPGTLSAALLCCLSSSMSMAAYASAGLIVHESFDGPADHIELRDGAAMVEYRVHEKVLNLPETASVTLDHDSTLSAQGGTIVFWLKPQWSDDNRSHVILTGKWNDGKNGYLAISQGWWEPLGQNRLYFIVNNQEFMHCSAPYKFIPGAWVMVTARWSGGKDGYCSIGVNDELIAEHRAPLATGYKNTGPLHIGSDMAAADKRNRGADFQLDDLRIYDRPVNDRFIRSLFISAKSMIYLSGQKEWDWMQATLQLPFVERRSADGVLFESRVVFDEDFHWARSREAADRILKRVKDAGFNVYVPCVWHGRGTHYPSPVTDADERLKSVIESGYDPLAYLIEKGHELGIEIHPWFTVMRREWNRYPEFYPAGTPEDAYDVHNQDFRDFMVNMILDVVDRYDVDGINLDYIRAMGICISASCQDDYKLKTGHDLQADYYLRFVAGSARQRLEKWQDAAVADIVKRVSVESRKLRSGIVISVDGHPKPVGEARPLEGRDELAWANDNLIDVIFAMDYRKRFDAAGLDAVRAGLVEPEKLYPLLGNYDRVDGRAVSRDSELIEKYVQYVRRRWPGSGVSFYIYNMISDEQLELLRSGEFSSYSQTYWPVMTNRVGHVGQGSSAVK